MRSLTTVGVFGATAILISCAGQSAHADTEAVTFPTASGYAAYLSVGATAGYTFTTNAAIEVTGLGAYFGANGGFLNPASVPVGLYDSGGTLLASATVTPADPKGVTFNYAPISPLFLAAGATYTVGGFYGTDFFANPTSETTAPQITYGGPVITEGVSGLTDPTAADPIIGTASGYFGGSFEFAPNASAVPETSPGLLLLLGLLPMGWATRKRRKG